METLTTNFTSKIDTIDTVDNIFRALTMPHEEREVRMKALRYREKQMDVDFWMKSFLKSVGNLIAEDGEETLPTTMTPVTLSDFDSYLAPYVGDKATLALLLDYDGTLSPICSHPDLAILPTETKKVILREIDYVPNFRNACNSCKTLEHVGA